MINRIIDFSEAPAPSTCAYAQLIVQHQDLPEVSYPCPTSLSSSSAPPSDLHPGGALRDWPVLAACSSLAMPTGCLWACCSPWPPHYQAERFAAQARAPLPMRKRLWRQIVRAKIKAQAALLTELHGDDHGVGVLALHVRSGDPSNLEARAARRYWPYLFADLAFRRHRENEDQNILLNYGYAVLRAIVARAVCAAGLHPSLGIHHHNRYDAFCLADDLMEPYRPTVDRAVAEYMSTHDAVYELEAAAKQHIIGELTGRYVVDGQQRTLFDTAARMASSLADVFLGNAEELELPDW